MVIDDDYFDDGEQQPIIAIQYKSIIRCRFLKVM